LGIAAEGAAAAMNLRRLRRESLGMGMLGIIIEGRTLIPVVLGQSTWDA
jgi:hypothetical protein